MTPVEQTSYEYVIALLTLCGEDDMHAVVCKTELEIAEPIRARTDAQVENDFAASEIIGSPKGGTRYGWRSQIVHDPNTQGYPPVERVHSYICIARSNRHVRSVVSVLVRVMALLFWIVLKFLVKLK